MSVTAKSDSDMISGGYWERKLASLDAIFKPKNVAVIGASEKKGSVGRTLLKNLVDSPFGGTVFPVNPKRKSVLGIKAYPALADVPEAVDLAVIATAAQTVPDVVKSCVAGGVKSAIIISAGFKERGPEGAELERRTLAEARKGQMRIIGPNCLGVMNPITGFNATFASRLANAGNVGFISQSGALCTAILDWSFQELVGFSSFVSIGSMLDIGWGDLIDYLGNDPHTKSILIYMESIGDARSFLSAAREVSLSKPIIVIKAGRTDAAAKAAVSHTGSLAGSDEVLDAAFRRAGVLRVDTIADLFEMADVLAKQPRPKGPRLAIITNAGGPGVLATDTLVTGGGELAEISDGLMKKFNEKLPPHWSHNNPVDVLGDAGSDRYGEVVDMLAADEANDGLLVILTPQAMTDPTQTAECIRKHAKLDDKPILASWMGGPEVEAGRDILKRANIPSFNYPDTASRMFNYMYRYAYNLRGIYETPSLPSSNSDQDVLHRKQADGIIERARAAGRCLLTEYESKQLLGMYAIPTIKTCIAKSMDEAVEIAENIGYPVVVKIHSETLTHKTDIGGVKLDLRDAAAVRRAWDGIASSVKEKARAEDFLGVTVQPMHRIEGTELIVGSSIDPQFGPVLLFGAGGQLVEVIRDRALAIPPINTTLAQRMIEQTQVLKVLKGVRGRKPVDIDALKELLVRFSQLVVEKRWIKEIDINPLVASSEGLLALDARVVLHAPNVSEDKLPHPAIRPYPARYIKKWTLKNGLEVKIRPIRAADEPLMVRFHESLSEESIRNRYFHSIRLDQRISHDRLARRCFNDYDREIALVADYKNPETGEHKILGVARISRLPGTRTAEFACIVSDHVQRKGLGTELMSDIVEVAKTERIVFLVGEVLPENTGMLRIAERVGFTLVHDADRKVVRAKLVLEEGGGK